MLPSQTSGTAHASFQPLQGPTPQGPGPGHGSPPSLLPTINNNGAPPIPRDANRDSLVSTPDAGQGSPDSGPPPQLPRAERTSAAFNWKAKYQSVVEELGRMKKRATDELSDLPEDPALPILRELRLLFPDNAEMHRKLAVVEHSVLSKLAALQMIAE
jgi:hypothetical protein